MRRASIRAIAAAAAATALAGCGHSNHAATAAKAPTAAGQTPGPLSAEAQSAATGDIPDNQVFLRFTDRSARYTIKYPEGWAQRGRGGDVTFQDKNNVIHVVVGPGAPPTPAGVVGGLSRAPGSRSLHHSAPATLTLAGARAVKVSYTTTSAPNPVTGKRVTLMVDRYELAAGGRRAIVDLATPRGVDNVDAYRLIIHSFRWL